MKRVKKILTAIVILVLIFGLGTSVFASEGPTLSWIHTTRVSADLSPVAGGYNISGSAIAKGYTVSINVTLEKQVGQTWQSQSGYSFSDSGDNTASAGGTRSLNAGTYRTHVFVNVYSGSILVESISDQYSSVITVS